MVSLRSFFRLAELVNWQPLAIWFALVRRALRQQRVVRFQERQIRCKAPQKFTRDDVVAVEQTSCKHLQRLIFYQSRTCVSCSSAVRNSPQTMSDWLAEYHCCFDAGWVELLQVATHQHLTNSCFGCAYQRVWCVSWSQKQQEKGKVWS